VPPRNPPKAAASIAINIIGKIQKKIAAAASPLVYILGVLFRSLRSHTALAALTGFNYMEKRTAFGTLA